MVEEEVKEVNSKTFFFVAAEESANQYLDKILKLNQSSPTPLKAKGVGFRYLQKSGAEIFYPAEDLAVMGVLEVFKKLKIIRRALKTVLDRIEQEKPESLVLLDYGGFNLKLAKAVKTKFPKVRIIYYILPKIWAWRSSRVKKIEKYVDEVLVIHPFEVDFYESHGVQAQFVGHPLLDLIDFEKHESAEQIKLQKSRCGLSESAPVLGVMLGSRRFEIQNLKSDFIACCEDILKQYPNIQIVFLVAPSVDLDWFKEELGDLDFRYHLFQEGDSFSMISKCDYMLVASGTATLQVGLLAKPMVIAYKMNPITAALGRWLVKGVKYFGLINIIHENLVVPEYLQEEVNSLVLSNHFKDWMADSSKRSELINRLSKTKTMLGGGGAAERVLAVIMGSKS